MSLDPSSEPKLFSPRPILHPVQRPLTRQEEILIERAEMLVKKIPQCNPSLALLLSNFKWQGTPENKENLSGAIRQAINNFFTLSKKYKSSLHEITDLAIIIAAEGLKEG